MQRGITDIDESTMVVKARQPTSSVTIKQRTNKRLKANHRFLPAVHPLLSLPARALRLLGFPVLRYKEREATRFLHLCACRANRVDYGAG